MIQFNLLPDIKIQYLRANRQKHLVVLVSFIVIIASLVALGILLSVVYGLQKKNISDLSSDIEKASTELKNTPNLTKILTVQNQLKALPALHDAKPVVTRLFSYLATSTPKTATNSRILTDFVQNTLSLSGTADSLGTVNTYIDALKGTTFRTTEDASVVDKPAFSNVVLSSFGRDSKTASYTITLSFDPLVFSEASDVVFSIGVVPKNGAGQ